MSTPEVLGALAILALFLFIAYLLGKRSQ